MFEFTLENLLLGAVCVGIVTVAVLYFTGKIVVKCDTSKNGYTYDAYRGTGSNTGITTGCGYLAETIQGNPDEKQINSLCTEYQQVCGNGSTSAQLLGMDINFEGPNDDGNFLNMLQQEVLAVKLNSSQCAPLLKCDPKKMVNCPPFLSCNNGSCN